MKKSLLFLAITVVTSNAQAAPIIYGKAFVTTDYVDSKADYAQGKDRPDDIAISNLQVNSNSSRIGVKGSEAISENTDVIYQLEYGSQIDGNNGNISLSSRDTYIGLTNKTFGELRFGRNTSILGYTDEVTHNKAYWDNLGNTKLESTKIVSALNTLDYIRQDNSVLWIAPKYNNLQLVMQYAVDESSNNDDDGYGATLKFDQDAGFTAAIAYSNDIEAKGSIDSLKLIEDKEVENSVNYGGKVIRGAITIDLNKYIKKPIALGLLYQQADYDFVGSDLEKGLIASAQIQLTSFARPTKMYLQYNKTDNLNGINNNDSNQLVLGGEYAFKDNIIGHSYVGKNSANYTDPMDITKSVADINVFALGAGLEYLFQFQKQILEAYLL